MKAHATQLATLGLVALLSACGGGDGGHAAAFLPAPAPVPAPAPAPAPVPAPSPPQPAVIIDVSQPWVSAQPADVYMDGVTLSRATSDASAIPRFRSLLVARHGKLVLEDYFGGTHAGTAFDVRSVTKSIVSLLTAEAIADGKISLDSTVGDFLGAPYSLDAGDRAVTVRQLLTMTSRYRWDENTANDYNDWVLSADHVQFLLDRAQNGSADTFTYNSAAVNLLGVLLQKAVGEPLPQYASDKLFTPLGITNVNWELLETDMVNAGAGIQLTAPDLLRLGQLVLQQGNDGATQLVPASWIDGATTPKFAWRAAYGQQGNVSYGYLFWVADAPATPVAFAWGYGGQFIYVVPTLDLVVVATTEWRGVSAEIDPVAFASQILTLIVSDVLTAAR
jgi:CubicO group peptidase (beta-lactamase class C family)